MTKDEDKEVTLKYLSVGLVVGKGGVIVIEPLMAKTITGEVKSIPDESESGYIEEAEKEFV